MQGLTINSLSIILFDQVTVLVRQSSKVVGHVCIILNLNVFDYLMQIFNLKYLICMVVMFNHRQEFIRHGKFCKSSIIGTSFHTDRCCQSICLLDCCKLQRSLQHVCLQWNPL